MGRFLRERKDERVKNTFGIHKKVSCVLAYHVLARDRTAKIHDRATTTWALWRYNTAFICFYKVIRMFYYLDAAFSMFDALGRGRGCPIRSGWSA